MKKKNDDRLKEYLGPDALEEYDPDPDTWEEFDFIDSIEDADRAMRFLELYDVTDTPDTPEEIDFLWEDIHQAAERHGFTVTTAHFDAYVAARAFAEAIAHVTVPAYKLNRIASEAAFESDDAARAAAEARKAARKASPQERETAKAAAREAAAKAREAEKIWEIKHGAYLEAQGKAREAAKAQLRVHRAKTKTHAAPAAKAAAMA